METIKLSKKELRALLFWASIAVSNAEGGAYEETILKVLVRLTKFLKFRQGDFCLFGYKSKRLGKRLIEKLNKELKLRIKLS